MISSLKNKIFSSKRKTLTILLFIHIGVLIWRTLFVIYGFTDLHFEEAQYWMWAKKIDWSYYSKPPMIAYFNYLSTSLLGDTEIGIRFNAIFLGFLSSFIIFYFTKELFNSNRKAFIASVLTYAMPFFHGSFIFFSTDSLLTFFWLLFLYLFWKSINSQKYQRWIISGLCFGFGILSKYTMLLAIPFMLIYIYIFHKIEFKKSSLYILLLIALVCIFPLVIWSIEYNFVNFKHISSTTGIINEKKDWLRQLHKFIEYFGSQLLIISPFFIILYISVFKSFTLKNKKTYFLLLAPVLSFFSFVFVSFIRGSGVNINWPMFAYATLPIALANFIVDKKKFMHYYISFSLTVILLFLTTQTPLLDRIGLGKLLPPVSDPAKKIVGWQELGNKISSLKEKLGKNCFVFSNEYYTTTEMSFYVKEQEFAYYYNTGNRMTQFDFWEDMVQFENKGYNAIYIEKNEIGKQKFSHRNKPKKINPTILNAFDELIDYQTHIIRFRNKDLYLFHIYVLKDFKTLLSTKKGY